MMAARRSIRKSGAAGSCCPPMLRSTHVALRRRGMRGSAMTDELVTETDVAVP